MKSFLSAIILLCTLSVAAQKTKCEWSVNVKDSLGHYKAMKEFIMHEQVFGSSSTYIFFNLHKQEGLPYLSFKFLKKSKDFVPAECFNKSSRLFLQLDNGKVVTLIHPDVESCGTSIYNEGFNSMLLEGNFLFTKGSIEDLQESPISMIRIRYGTATVDYPLKSSFTSELDKITYEPQRYFIDRAKCLLD